MGGATIAELSAVQKRDAGYFCANSPSAALALILNMGVVDSAPRPFTYHLKKLSMIPCVGPRFWRQIAPALHAHRAQLQRISYFRLTPPSRFRSEFASMVSIGSAMAKYVLSVDTPLTPAWLESRSPGFRDSIATYNSIKHECAHIHHQDTTWIDDSHYLECGHHFNAVGHALLANCLVETLQPALTSPSA